VSATLHQLATSLAVLAAFALFQSPARGQPLSGWAAARARWRPAALRLGALLALAVAGAIAARSLGAREAALFVITALGLVASLFVLLAAVARRACWTLAVASPALCAVCLLAAEGLA
jgi:hypothetical protein